MFDIESGSMVHVSDSADINIFGDKAKFASMLINLYQMIILSAVQSQTVLIHVCYD